MADYLKKIRTFEYQIDKYDNETHYKEILLKYRPKKPKRKKSIEDIKKSGLLERNRFIRGFLPKSLIEKYRNIDDLPKSYYAQQIRQAIQTVPMPDVLPQMQKRINRQALNRFGNKYAVLANDYLKDVKMHYIETIRQFHLKQFAVLTGQKNEIDSNEKFKFKHSGRTTHYKKFLRHRKMIEEKLFIPRPFIRFILHSSNQYFPQVLNEYDGYKLVKSGIPVWFQLDDFEAIAQRDLENKSIFIREQWYPKIVHVLTKHYRKRTFSTVQWSKMLNCAKGLINRQITELKINTFEHIFDVISKRKSMPPIKFQAICSNGCIELNPDFNEIVATYKRIFKNIAAIATKLIPLEPLVDRLAFITADNYLKIEIAEITLNEMIQRLEDELKMAYKPILEYIEMIANEYNDLLSEQTQENLDIFLTEPKEIDEYFEKVQYFQDFIEKIQKTAQTRIFDNAIVNQTKALVGLRTIAQDYVNKITEKIVTGHRDDCQKICDWFANVKKRASEAPKATETLLENGEFMLQMKNKKIAEISQHIQGTLIMSGRLLDLTQLSDDHFNLQISTIHWLNNIQEIFEQNSSQFEIYKNQFEEHLGEVTKKLTQDIDELLPKLTIIDDMCDTTKLRDYYATLDDFLQQIKCFEDYINWINKEEKLFKLPVSQYPIVEFLKDYVKPFAELIKLCIEWLRYYYIWMDGPFEYLNAAIIESLVQNYKKDFEARQKYYRNRIKSDMLGDPVLKFRGQTEDPDPEKHPVPLRLCNDMINWLNRFQIGVSIVKIMCNPTLRDRHWAEMSSIAGFDLTPNAGTSLRKITKCGINHLLQHFETISIGANKELKLQMDLADMIEQWEHVDFPFEDFKDTEIKIIGNIEDIQVLLDDHIIKTLSMRGSAFAKPCEQEVRKWYERLLRTSRIFDEWIEVQNGWLYYLPILSSKDISEELPIEDKLLFTKVNDIYCKYTKMAIEKSNVMRMMDTEKLLEDLTVTKGMLEQIQEGVYAYLERKRLFFSRFFFLSNTELLQILSETKNPEDICKCFNGIWRVRMNNNERIDAMLSRMNEEIMFQNSVSMIGSGANVEKWLLGVEKEMYSSIKHDMINSYADYLTSDRINWALGWSQMIVLVISNIFWTSDIHASLLNQNRDLLVNIHNEIEKNLMELTAIIRSNEMTNLNRITLKTLCILDVHARDVTLKLINNPNSNIECFQWLSQLKYYWNNNEVVIRSLNSSIPYGYEYLGNFERIVITPLSERCMLSILLAFGNQMNASIEGPTATGKSETIKELAKFLAIQFKCFDCTPDVGFGTISQYLKGVATSGAWLCLEEFNCIGIQTLSVIAQKLRILQMAKRTKVSRFVFDGFKIRINQNCNVCIVSGPSFRQSKLPDNLKSFFRPIVMVSPDVEQIVDVSLLANGFKNVRSTAKRIVEFYKMCSELLPQQKYLDFGLRNIKIALRACANKLITKTAQDFDEELIYQSLLDVNLPKINVAHLPTFRSIVKDIFPEANPKPKEVGWIQEIFNKMCLDKQFQPNKAQYQKLLEAYECIDFRTGLMLVGNPYTGKSFILQTLAKVVAAERGIDENDMEIAFINPGAVELNCLFDGIVSSVVRQSKPENSGQWIVFDGPVYSDWADNLNSVLDDNRKLCLSSGEVLELKDNTSLIFEVDDLKNASPSMISRVGIIYFEPSTLDWQCIAKSWIETCKSNWITECKSFLWDLFEWVLPPVINYIDNHGVNLINPLQYNLLRSTFEIIQMVIDDVIKSNSDDHQKFLPSWIQAAIMYAIAWGIGGILNDESRKSFDQFHRKIWGCNGDYLPPATIKSRLDVSFPNEGCLNDYCYIFKQKGTWKLWIDIVRRQEAEIMPLGVYVATADTARFSYMIDLHIKNGKNFLLVGSQSTGKTYFMQNVLMKQTDTNKMLPAPITFNLNTTAKDVYSEILCRLVKLKRGIYGPPKGKDCVMFIDNLNIQSSKSNQSNCSTELIRQIFDYSFIYDLKGQSKIHLENVSMLTACGIPGGRYRNLDLRFMNHFNCFSINELSDESKTRIFTSVLSNGFRKSGHAADVIGNVTQIVTATMQIYADIIDRLKPTPKRPHYCFNMRDILRVCTGCSLLKKESVENKKMFAKIWFHESLRVFADRLLEVDEKKWVYDKLTEQINDTSGTFRDSMEIVFETYVNDTKIVTMDSIKNLLFGSYMDSEAETPNKKYEEISSLSKLANVVTVMISEYPDENERSDLDIVLFSHALEHLNRICRIISTPCGSGFLIGSMDSGRKTLVRLAAVLCKQTLFQLRIEPNYSLRCWREDIKRVLKTAGVKNAQTILYLSENQFNNDVFLTDIDYLLNCGDIPNLWPIDEKQELLEMVRLVAQGGNRNIDISADEVFSFFVNRCHQNLHIIISFSSNGSQLRRLIEMYPSIVNCCTIDVFENWPDDALDMVASKFLQIHEFSAELSSSIVTASKYFHRTASEMAEVYRIQTNNNMFVTSSSYLAFINRFTHLYNEKWNEISRDKSRYVQGLDTLLNAAKAIENMQHELSELEPKLRAMAENCRTMTAEIELKTIEASVATEQVRRDELIANDQAASAEQMEDECSKDLAQAVPVLEDALQSLNTLKPADITLVKSMKNPPSAVKLVMAAVCVMKRVPPDRINDAASGKKIVDYWGPSKRILGDMGFLQSLKDYDKEDISPDILRKIRKDFIPHKDFQPHIVAKASSAAEGLCKWIKAIENFEAVNAIVRPKKIKLIKAKQNLRETRKYLAEKRALAAELDAKVDGLHEALEKTNREKEQTELETSMCQKKLERAETLINSLGQEKNRWTEKTFELQRLLDNLPGDILISSGLIAYLGALSESYRDQCTVKWHEYCIQQQIPCSKVFSLISCLGHENEIQEWRLNGLASDESSTENIILATKSRRQCLFIDPEMQANKWIKRTETKNHLKVVKQSDPTYFNVLQNCMEDGTPILIEDVIEPLDICLNHTLQYRVTSQNQSFKLHSDLSIQISPNFRLYLTSNARNSNFLLNKTGKINIVNFIFALPGLEETLLDMLVLKENPYLREERDQLLQNKLKDKTLQIQYENAILTAISECDGDILEDETAIRRMDNSKQLYVEVINKQTLYSEAEHEIEIYRESYRKVSAYAAVLYECLDYLRSLNPMYQFSLDWYFNMYDYSVENANCSRDLNRKIDFLIKSITKNLYQSICRSIFDADKLLFSWIIVTNMLMDEKRLKVDQLNFFIAGDKMKMGPMSKKPDCDWISDEMWCDLCNLATFIDSDEFLTSFQKYSLEWKSYYDDYTKCIPNQLNITAFEEIMVSKIFHPENIKKSITNFISNEVGEHFVNPHHFDIHKSFDESDISTPLIFVLSPGVDPTNTLWDFAEKLNYSQSMELLSMGADQGSLIEKAIVNAQRQGHWICIQNCHLNTQFLRKVERIWEAMDISNTLPTFRLWMTSEPIASFPLNLLQNGIKITYERSTGLKSNLLNLYQTSPLSTEFYDSCPEQDKIFKKFLYLLTVFDVILNERKHYGSIGWKIAYEFTHNDFEQSVQLLQQFLSDGKEVPFETLRYIIGEFAYGGRIVDKFDKRLLDIILMDLFNKNILTDFVVRMMPNDEFKLPRRLERRMVLKFIEENVPNETNCELYGLHVNSDFIYKLGTSAELLSSMRLTSGQVHKDMENEFDNIKSELKLIIKKLPQRIEIESDGKELFSYENSMTTIVLVSEMKHYNDLLNVIRSTCEDAHRALEGVVSLTQTLEEIVKSIWKNIVPKPWIKMSYPSQKSLSSYLKDFFCRYDWLCSWWNSNQFPVSYWFPIFFHPQSFLAATKLNFARKYKLPIDQLTFDFAVHNDAPNEAAEDGAYIHGLFLKAAHWNGNLIEEQLPGKPIEAFPIIHIKPILQNELQRRGLFECPVYQTSGQRKIEENSEIYNEFSITTVLIPTADENHCDFWVKRGVVLVCQPDD